mgnify:CR=1 FL=1
MTTPLFAVLVRDGTGRDYRTTMDIHAASLLLEFVFEKGGVIRGVAPRPPSEEEEVTLGIVGVVEE